MGSYRCGWGHPASPCPMLQPGAELQLRSTPRTWGCNAFQWHRGFSSLPCPPCYLQLLVQRLLVHRRVGAAEISHLAMPEVWKENG